MSKQKRFFNASKQVLIKNIECVNKQNIHREMNATKKEWNFIIAFKNLIMNYFKCIWYYTVYTFQKRFAQ